ncbi:MAG TPA: hemolysin III family protein [Mycobacteriales bacterium]|nr:hemolysin III family protein [Mycobacteriales bacterium]
MTDPRDLAAAARTAGSRAVERTSEAVAEVVAAAKPKLRGWLHTVTSPLALGAGIVLVALAPSTSARLAASAFALTSFLLFTTSALYHRGTWSPAAERRLKRMDHANIFLLIAGSYTPFAVLALKGDTRVALMGAVWGTALIGIAFRVLWVGAPRWSYVPLYIGLGWAMAFVFPQLIHGAGVAAFVLVAVGGLLYTFGGLVYGLKRPNPSPRWFGFHEIFHTCTVAAFACQYIAASFVVYRAA